MQNHISNPILTHGDGSSVEPRIVFFSGGSALKRTSQILSTFNKNSVHIITTFDSGGSSGYLRQAFSMPAIGDLRNRILALADKNTIPDSMIEFMNFRLSKNLDQDQLRNQFISFCKKNYGIWQGLPSSIFIKFSELIDQILSFLPKHFNFTNLCIGNLLMASYYLCNGRNLYNTVEYFRNLFKTKGIIIPISESNLHLAAHLVNNHLVIGQHRLKNYGKYIDTIFLTSEEPVYGETESNINYNHKHLPSKYIPEISSIVKNHIRNADIICYPIGSFYSSLVANLLPSGIADSILKAKCKKVFIPNTGYDPEIDTKTIFEQVKIIQKTLSCDILDVPISQIISTIILDLTNGKYNYSSKDELRKIEDHGIEIIDSDICTYSHPNTHNPENIIKQLYILANSK